MIGNLKLKVRGAAKEEAPSRRIKTEMNENGKKISVYINKPRAPLAENKKIFNDNDTLTLKKQKPIKSLALKPPSNAASKLNTEAKDPDALSLAQRQAAHRIFGAKKDPALSVGRDRGEREGRESSRLSGAARYAYEDKVGSGTFGVVHKARDKKTLELVAIKRVFQDKKYKNRELEILRTLNHPCVLRIRDSFFTYEGDKEYLNVVMDYFPSNLYEHAQKYRGRGEIGRLKLKVLAYQLFRGLLYLARQGIAHRDIKPQNVLVDDANWRLLICDFGSAKRLQPGEPNLAYICSRCYRAPELIFGSTGYSPQIDVWSAGCILVELLTLEPVFRSESNIDQLVEIIKVLGTPSHEEMMEMNPDCEVDKYQFPKITARPWEKVSHCLRRS
jgi:serine/threonine protein kinase